MKKKWKLSIVIAVCIVVVAGAVLILVHLRNSNDKKQAAADKITASVAHNKKFFEKMTSDPSIILMNQGMLANKDLKIHKGGTVEWRNIDTASYQIVSDAASGKGPNSPVIAPGQVYSYVFDSVGTFSYHGGVKPAMKGTVTVTE